MRDVVVVAEDAVAREAGGGRLPPAVHGDEVDVDVDEQVGLRRPLVDLDLLALVGGAEERHRVGVLGVEVVERPGRCEGVVHAVADGVAQLGLGHAAVQGERGDEVHVVDAGLRRHVEHRLDHALADVGPAHRRQRQRDVVERDRQLHAREQQLGQRLRVAERVEQRVADGAVAVLQRFERLGRVDDAGAVGRQPFEAEPFAVPEQQSAASSGRRRARIQGEASTASVLFSSRRSNAIFTAPRAPALAACSMASR